jgi:hypothetical protein
MKANTKLAIWLSSRKKDYTEGVEIFKELGIAPEKNRFFTTPVPGTMQKNLLATELQRYARVKNIKPISEADWNKLNHENQKISREIVTPQKPVIGDNFNAAYRPEILKNKVDYNLLPENLKVVYDEFKNLYEQYEIKRAEMHEVPEGAEHNGKRKVLAEEIVELKKNIRTNWDAIDDWYNSSSVQAPQITQPSGKLTREEIEKIEDLEIKALSKKLRIEANLRFISRNQNKTDSKTLANLQTRQNELTTWGIKYD